MRDNPNVVSVFVHADEKFCLDRAMERNSMTEKEMKSIKMSTLYELRLLFTQGEKTNYTKEEIVELLDKIASAKEQE